MSETEQRYYRHYDQYGYLSILINLSKNLPESVQLSIGDNLLATIKAYISFLRQYSGFKKLEPKIYWSLYLGSRYKKRWYDEIPELQKAYNLLIVLPDHVLHYLDDCCEELVVYLSPSDIAERKSLLFVREQIERYLCLTMDQLMVIQESSYQSKTDKACETDPLLQDSLKNSFDQWLSQRKCNRGKVAKPVA